MEYAKSLLQKIPLGCKVIYVVSFILYILGFIIPTVHVKIASVPYMTYHYSQYWRLFFSFFSSGASILSIVSIIVDFLWIRFFFTYIEKTWSTSFFLTQVLIQNFVLQVIFTLVANIGFYIGIFSMFTMSFGWSPLIIIFIFKYTHKDQLEDFKLFCIPIPKRYLPYIIIGLSFFYGYGQFLSLIIASGLGFLQFSILKTHFIRLPLSLYLGIDAILPEKITKRYDFVKVRNVQNQLDSQCMKCTSQSKKQETGDRKKTRKTAKQSFDLNQQIKNNPSGVATVNTDQILTQQKSQKN